MKKPKKSSPESPWQDIRQYPAPVNETIFVCDGESVWVDCFARPKDAWQARWQSAPQAAMGETPSQPAIRLWMHIPPLPELPG